jgi:GTPase SAR1 family protein
MDFLISYAGVDRKWAEWIAWQLEEAGYSLIIQAWDFRPGSNFVINMQRGATEAERTIAVLSQNFLTSYFTQPEWAAAFAQDPTGEQGKLLPVRVRECSVEGLLASVVYVDLVGKDEEAAKAELLIGVQRGRSKPINAPSFPFADTQRQVPEQPGFPARLTPEAKKKGLFSWWTTRGTEDQESRNRHAMIEKVRLYWITGVLQQSLYRETLITPGLKEQPRAIMRPLDLFVQRPDGNDHPLPSNTRILEVFDAFHGSLLILGAPGAGKTTLLLELARDLLDHAEQVSSVPIPVVFPLSTWSEQRLPLAAWLVDELVKRYDVPRKVAKVWVENDQILPLLDGLDEVQGGQRASCVKAINYFRQGHGFLLPLVVCSRLVDYEAIGQPLRLQGAVAVQPCTETQVDDYLAQLGESVSAVRQALREDQTLRELVDTPLMLNILTLAYVGQSTDTIQTTGDVEMRRRQLFEAYVNRMFQRRSPAPLYSQDKTLHWLSWLAQQMVQHSQSVFYIEYLQPDWLPERWRWAPTTGVGISLGLIVGLLSGVVDWSYSGWGDLLCIELIIGFVSGLLAYEEDIKCVETVEWSWSTLRSNASPTLRYGLRRAILLGLSAGFCAGLLACLWGESFPITVGEKIIWEVPVVIIVPTVILCWALAFGLGFVGIIWPILLISKGFSRKAFFAHPPKKVHSRNER